VSMLVLRGAVSPPRFARASQGRSSLPRIVMAAALCAFAIAVAAPAAPDAQTSAAPATQRADLDQAYSLMRAGKPGEAIPVFESYVRVHPDDLAARRDFAYLLAHQGLLGRAIEQMEAARKLAPEDADIVLQLGYWYLDARRDDDALREFDAASRLAPADARPRLQRAYLLDARGEHYSAYRDFYAASRSDDPKLAAAATTSLRRLSLFGNAPQPAPWFGEIYLEHRAAERFGTQAGDLMLREGRELCSSSPWEGYLTARVAWLREETPGTLPVSISDNPTLIGIGLRTRPLKSAPGLTTYAELARVVVTPKFALGNGRTDFRAGFYYYDECAPRPRSGGVYGTGHVRDLYAEGAYYSRFGDNWIGSVRYRDGYRARTFRRSALDLYAAAQVWADSRGDYYNNVAEVGPGVRYLPDLPGNWQITVEYIRGSYLGRDRRTPNPFGSHYGDVRATIAVFGYF